MPKQLSTSKRGFTIIEVVLVLAIAGLIFMMVFIALPALQRSQRDTQRTNDISRLSSQLTQYQANNRGALPAVPGGSNSAILNVMTKYGSDGTSVEVVDGSNAKWGTFYKGYLLAGGDTFEDPSGAPYMLQVRLCGTKDRCDNSTQRINSNFEDNSYTEGTMPSDPSSNQDFVISIVINAKCQGEEAYYTAGNRKAAMLYKREGGGVICENI